MATASMNATATATLTANDLVEHSDYLTAYAVKMLRNRTEALEAVQETYLSALRNLGAYRGTATTGNPVAGWLTGILRTKCIDRTRAAKRNDYAPLETVADHNAGECPTVAVERNETLRQVMEAVAALPEKQRLAFTYCVSGDYTAKQAAQKLGVKENYVWQLVSRAKMGVREAMGVNV